jgi:hypothetical protein
MPAIKGRVISERAPAIGAITVELVNRTGDTVDQIQVDDEGRFILHVSPGAWKLRAYDPNGRRGEAAADVADEETLVELALG